MPHILHGIHGRLFKGSGELHKLGHQRLGNLMAEANNEITKLKYCIERIKAKPIAVDPSLVDFDDLEEPGLGRLVRCRCKDLSAPSAGEVPHSSE